MALDWSFGSRFHFLRFCFVEISFDLLGFSSYWLFYYVVSARPRVFSGGFCKIACLDAI